MLKLGEWQELTVEKRTDFGVYLMEPQEDNREETDGPAAAEERSSAAQRGTADRTGSVAAKNRRAAAGGAGEGTEAGDPAVPERVLLPKSQVPEGTKEGDVLGVFLYKDSEDRLIATRKTPKLKLHEVGWLTVSQVTGTGAFLDWGLDKDLLLPFHEQPRDGHVIEGQECLVAVYIDKSGRRAATLNVYPYLEKNSPYHTGDRVTGVVYETSDNFGVFVAVDSRYSALIPKREVTRPMRVGDVISARVTRVKPDGKLDLAIREKAAFQLEPDCEALERLISQRGGSLPFTDRADPEKIRAEVHMSKNEFKRAVGHLLKAGKVRILPDSIVLTKQESGQG